MGNSQKKIGKKKGKEGKKGQGRAVCVCDLVQPSLSSDLIVSFICASVVE